MKILFVGDLAATGFGSVTSDLGRALLARGLDVRFISQNDVGSDLPEPFRSRAADVAFYEYQVAAQQSGVSGVRSLLGDIINGIPGHRLVNGQPFGDWKPDAALLLGDFTAARILYARFGEELAKVPSFHYVPIEGTDLPPLWADLWKQLTPVAMSRFGQQEISKLTGTMPALAYHGVDTQTFYPVSPSQPLQVPKAMGSQEIVTLTSKAACKRFFGLDPDHKVILRCDRLMPRKRYPSLLRAMAPLLQEREDVRLLIHARAFDQGGYLPDSISKMPKEAQGRVIVTDRPGLPRAVLAAIYNCADLYVSTSAEGFGLTIAEAMACGVPAVGLDYSAVPEVIGDGGVLIPVGGSWDNEYDHLWAWPDEQQLTDAVAYLLDHPAKARALGQAAQRHVATTFSWAKAAQAFDELFSQTLVRMPAQDGTLVAAGAALGSTGG